MADVEAMRDKKEQSLRHRAMDIFVVPGAEAFDTNQLRDLRKSLPECLTAPADAYLANLDGSLSVLCLPMRLAIANSQDWRFNQIYIAERIRSDADPDADPNSSEMKEVLSRARDRFEEEMSVKESIDHVADQACSFLLHQHEQAHVADAAADLLLQGVVLVWSAFEVLVRDVFEAVINVRPELGRALLDSSEGKRLFQVKAIDLDTLARHSFDLSKCMGSVLCEFRDLSDLAAIRGVLGSLFQTAGPLQDLLRSKELWVLGQRRHLIVHNRGVVDRKYIENTGETDEVGKRIHISPRDIVRYVGLVRDIGHALLTAAHDKLRV